MLPLCDERRNAIIEEEKEVVENIKSRFRTLVSTDYEKMTEETKLQKQFDSEVLARKIYPFRDIRAAIEAASQLEKCNIHLSGNI